MTDWKALCEELADTLERAQRALRFEGGCSDTTDNKRRALIDNARAALAEPVGEQPALPAEGEGLTDTELFRIASDCQALYIADDVDYDNCSEVAAAMRAAIAADRARYSNHPAPPAEGEVAELALKELERTVVLLMPVTGKNKIKRFDTIRAALKRLQELKNKADLSPAPAPAGEVAELVAKLRRLAPHNPLGTADPTITRAADLLEQRHPAPVPVGERPWEREGWCDEDGRCWWFDPEDPGWFFDDATTCRHWSNFSLPHNALPLPQGEVE